ncbi:peptidase S8/S53 domain-containing protein [Catenaria anguillulae PL171]|uniref:Peptidase S8/S53 domain-containing protein n=1 Tax=Catenaria anguillulae PL171 TaxID=765915 RepID=A0A1Y2HLQ7_9FUNG|nr:peptidase S8/S53 domain-containing protein [Catenaria anguillulae PL171]
MGRQYGVSKLAKAISVKTVGSDAAKRTVVANASVGSDADDDVNAAAVAAVQAGVVVVTAAGNNQRDACLESPGVVPDVLTVAASSDRDRLEYVSNWGRCVDIVAPGSSVMSASKNGGSEVRTGTSFAAPHVAGAAALILAENPSLTPKQVAEQLLAKASQGVLDRKGLRGTPNVLLRV